MPKEKKEPTNKKQSKPKEEEVKEITLEYKLHELPSSQHKAGLAGLVLMVRWLTERNQHKIKGILEELECTDKIYKLRIDKDGMKSLFDETYSASWEEVGYNTISKKKNKKTGEEKIKEPIRIDESTMIDPKTGKEKKTKKYIYPKVIPLGSFLFDWDNSNEKIWIKLFRDCVWDVLRVKPLTQKQYSLRADSALIDIEEEVNEKDGGDDDDEGGLDYESAWDYIIHSKKDNNQDSSTMKLEEEKKKKKPKLKGYNFLGAESRHSDGNGFFDTGTSLLLLNFWIFTSEIYIPQKLEYDNSTKKYKPLDDGYVISVPDILDLETFCLDYYDCLKKRKPDKIGIRPRDAKINITEEAGWATYIKFRESINEKTFNKDYSDLLIGVDIFRFFIKTKGNKEAQCKAIFRIRPSNHTLKEYEAFKSDNYFDPVFKKLSLINIASGNDWSEGFDKILFATNPDYFFGSGTFARDINKKFKLFVNLIQKEKKNMGVTEEDILDEKPEVLEKAQSKEEIIYWMVWRYISQKLASKHGLTKEKSKTPEYAKEKEKLAKEIFLGMRGKSGKDFIEYFVTSVCDVGQFMDLNRYMEFQNFLYQETDKVKVLSMLALSGISYSYNKEEKTND